MTTSAKLGIAVDQVGWWIRFETFAKQLGLHPEVLEIERSDWLQRVQRCDYILWRPNLDPPFCEEAKEKIFFIENVLKKRVFPNWSTFWHYDNKKAQAYLLSTLGLPTPHTFVSYSKAEALDYLRSVKFPLVSKSATGASSEGVKMLRDAGDAVREVDRVFGEPLWSRGLRRAGITLRLTADAGRRYVLWQEFIPDNPRDLRITIIAHRYAFAFFRNNRANDFRASGSGRLDYCTGDVRAEIEFCLKLCRDCKLDTMAFDIVYRNHEPVILEMSYTFNDRCLHDAPGYFEVGANGALVYREGHVWPQELILRHVRTVMESHGS